MTRPENNLCLGQVVIGLDTNFFPNMPRNLSLTRFVLSITHMILFTKQVLKLHWPQYEPPSKTQYFYIPLFYCGAMIANPILRKVYGTQVLTNPIRYLTAVHGCCVYMYLLYNILQSFDLDYIFACYQFNFKTFDIAKLMFQTVYCLYLLPK